MSIAVETESLSKSYGSTWALRRISFRVAKGEIAVIHGANGAGKSTLLNCLSGMLRPGEGTIRVGTETWDAHRRRLPDYRALKVGVVTSRPFLYPHLTIEENLFYFAGVLDISGPDGAVGEILERLSIAADRKKRIDSCSDGIVRRANLARACLGDPSVYLLDEPLVHLDWKAQEQTVELFSRLAERGAAVICSSHEPELWKRATRVRSMQLEHGRLAEREERAAGGGARLC